jgi:alpha-L-rhamnosidase
MALARGVLGIDAVEPGYSVCIVSPQRCGLDWVRGAVPTNWGPIEIEWRGTQGEIALPRDVTARLAEGRTVRGPAASPSLCHVSRANFLTEALHSPNR